MIYGLHTWQLGGGVINRELELRKRTNVLEGCWGFSSEDIISLEEFGFIDIYTRSI